MINNIQKTSSKWQKDSFLDCVSLWSKIGGVKKTDYKETGLYPVIDQGKETISAYTDNQDHLINKPFILFGDHTRIIKKIDFNCVLSNDGVKAFDTIPTIDLNYFYYYISALEIPNTGYNRHFKYLTEKTIYYPPLPTQQKIATILSTIDDAIQKTDQIIKKTEKLKNGLIIDIFSKKQEYKRVKINEISEVTSSKRIMVSDYVESGIPFYRSTEIIKKSKNIEIHNDIFISKEKFNEIKSKFGSPQKNDILVSSVGTIGDIYLVQDEEFYFKDGNLLWIREIGPSMLPEYLKTILSSKLYRDKLNIIAGGSSQKALTIEKFGSVEISVPPIEEQKNICDIIGAIDIKLNFEKANMEKLSILKHGLMNDIFSQKVEVKNG